MSNNNQINLAEVAVTNALAGDIIQHDGTSLVKLATNSVATDSLIALKKLAGGTLAVQVIDGAIEGPFAPKDSATSDATLTIASTDKKIVVTGGYKIANLPNHASLPDGTMVEIVNFAQVTNGSGGNVQVNAYSGSFIHNSGSSSMTMENGDSQLLELYTHPSGSKCWIKRA